MAHRTIVSDKTVLKNLRLHLLVAQSDLLILKISIHIYGAISGLLIFLYLFTFMNNAFGSFIKCFHKGSTNGKFQTAHLIFGNKAELCYWCPQLKISFPPIAFGTEIITLTLTSDLDL